MQARSASPYAGTLVSQTALTKKGVCKHGAKQTSDSSTKGKHKHPSVTEINDQINDVLKAKFNDFSALQIDGVLVDKLTMRQRLTKDKLELWDQGKRRFPSKYFPEIRDLYKGADQPESILKPRNPEDQHSK